VRCAVPAVPDNGDGSARSAIRLHQFDAVAERVGQKEPVITVERLVVLDGVAGSLGLGQIRSLARELIRVQQRIDRIPGTAPRAVMTKQSSGITWADIGLPAPGLEDAALHRTKA
jgi:hypothetical protein